MFAFLKNHPFSIDAFFDSSLVVTFAVPKAHVQHLIPECLILDTYNDEWAFIAVAIVQTKGLRPKGFPQFMGNNFILIGYRIFVRYTNSMGKNLRGLYILQSETDRRKMELLGNIFTHYNYTTTDIKQTNYGYRTEIRSTKSGFNLTVEDTGGEISLPAFSPFENWKEARRFAGPLPFTFTYNQQTKKVLIIEGVREKWIPQPVKVLDYKFALLESPNLKSAVLANAFIIKDIPYHWKKGRIEQWKG